MAAPARLFTFRKAVDPSRSWLPSTPWGSMEPKLATVKNDLGSLFKELAPGDVVGLIAFSNRPFLLQPLATPHSAQGKLNLLQAYGQTALYDSVEDSVRLLAHQKGQKVLVLITD